ncbi:MAG: DegT/DnrJ/EryC1/StrS family aminotransferase [Bryobacterales bacterium]|nr:DegT/DnrJ/EryC1/StrS family aminotransferase [Bryobacterales bacterium]
MERRHFLHSTALGAMLLKGLRLSGATDVPALLGGTPVRREKWASWPVFNQAEENGLLEVLRSGMWWRGEGKRVAEFERAYSQMMGSRYCLATANGTSALVTSLGALGVGAGDEVIVPPYTFVATVNAVLIHYALPVFVDTDVETFQMNHRKLRASVTPATKVIMPVHLGGAMSEMDEILEVASERKIPVVEDACQAHMAEWRGKKSGTLGKAGCFSFQGSKNLNAGEGGAILSNDEEFIESCYAFHNNGRARKVTSYNFSYASNGANLRMTEFQGAILLAQMRRLEAQSSSREQNARYLSQQLRKIEGITPAAEYSGSTRNAYHLYMFRYDPQGFAGLPRSIFIKALNAEGIGCGGGYSPLTEEPFLKQRLESSAYKKLYGEKRLNEVMEQNRCPDNVKVCNEAVWFTQTMLLGGRKDMDNIVDAILKIQKRADALKAQA